MQEINEEAARHGLIRRRPRASIGVAAAAALASVAALGTFGTSEQSFAQFQPGVNAPTTFADVVERVSPSVVSIRVTSGNRLANTSRGDEDGDENGQIPFPDLSPDHPLNEFFRDLPRRFGQQGPNRRIQPRLQRSQGSGFVISEDGYVVTNNHVVRNAGEVSVVFGRDEEYTAKVVGTDARTDLALLKIDTDKRFTPVKFADAEGRVGDWVIAVGNPFGLGGTVTVGIISSLARDIGSGPYDFMQIDAAINRGNSGGPTFNLSGEVIGVNTAIYSPSGGNVGIAFAVPASTAKSIIEQLKNEGRVSRGWLGVRIENVTEEVAASLGLEKEAGALVVDFTDKSPAQTSGLRVGDTIIRVGGEEIEDSRDLARRIGDYAPGTTVDIDVRRGSENVTVQVTLGQFPNNPQQLASAEPNVPAPSQSQGAQVPELGLSIEPSDDPERKGVVISDVASDGPAAEKGLADGDLIVQVNSDPIETPTELREAIDRAKKLGRPSVLLMVLRGETRQIVPVSISKDKS